jgi:hypothetical protein
VGAVAALLFAAIHLSLILALSPYAHKSDHFVAVCSNALLCMVILMSVLLKMNGAYLVGTSADGIDPEAASRLLVASNALVVVVSVAAYFISAKQAVHGEQEFDAFASHDHSGFQEPLLHSRPGTPTTAVDEGGAGSDRELLVTAAESTQSTSSSSSEGSGCE